MSMGRMPKCAPRNRTHIAALLAPTLAATALAGAVVTASTAQADSYISEPFTGNTPVAASDWSTSNVGSGAVCLTALSSTASAIALNGATTLPGCSSSPATVGSGALRLVGPSTGLSGSIFYKQPQSTTYGLDITFTMSMVGSGATNTIGNGLSFFLKDGSNASDTAGPGGAPLGYARDSSTSASGVPGGLVGVGFDVYGGYSDSDYFGGNGCASGGAGPSASGAPNTLGVRGPDTSSTKNGGAGYCWISGTTSLGALYGATESAAQRKVRIVVDPNTASPPKVKVYVGAAGGGAVPASPTLEFNQPTELTNATSFKFGFSGSTGAAILAAYVWNLQIQTQVLYAVPGNYTYAYGTNPGTISPTVVYQTTLGDATTNVANPATGNTGWVAPTCSATGTFDSSTSAGTSTGAIGCSGGNGGTRYSIDTTSVANVIVDKATPACTVTPYSTGYTGSPITATGSCTGVGGATLSGLDLSGTTHTNAGTYSDSWTFTNANYSNASGTVSNTINALAPAAPAAPTSSATGNGTVSLAWVAPAANGAAITGYNVQVATSSGGSYANAAGCTSLAVVTSCTATGLTNGTPYYFKVRATNSAGDGSYSAASSAFTPTMVPLTPAAPTSSVTGNGTVSLAWVAPAVNGTAITGYNVQVATSSGGSYANAAGCTSLAVVTSCTATGLTNGTPYYFKVRATNSAGDGRYSAASSGFIPVAAASETATPEPKPTSTPTQSSSTSVGPITPGSNPNVPAGGLPLGASVLLINGQAQPVTVVPNAPSKPTGLVATGSDFTLRLSARDAGGKAMGLGSSGELVLQRAGGVAIQGDGFRPNSDVAVYLFNETRLLGTVKTDATGAVIGTVPLPLAVLSGRHTMQTNGFARNGAVRSLSLSVEVRTSAASSGLTRTREKAVNFAPGSAKLSPKARRALRSWVKDQKAMATRTVVVGFMQAGDGKRKGTSLSKRRARAVAAYLKPLGVKGVIASRGAGVAKKSRAAGRKVVIRLTYRTQARSWSRAAPFE